MGMIAGPLIEDMPAMGKTPTALARDMEKALGTFIRDPVVTVIVTAFRGTLTVSRSALSAKRRNRRHYPTHRT
jgi:protein involved in polysaccharide export with SLBB domain